MKQFYSNFSWKMLANYYQNLKELIAFKTVASDVNCTKEIYDASVWLNNFLQENWFDSKIVKWYGNPIVFASFEIDKNLPTCLFYSHYDVQAAEKSDGRKHDPFSLYIWKDNIIGRWVSDNKWILMISLMSIFDLIKEWKLWCNLKIIIEGDETLWSHKLNNFLQDNKEKIKSDFFLVSDSNIISDNPCLDMWYRWNINMKLTLVTAKTDLHSGNFGGLVPNAIHELSLLLSRLYDINNHVTIPYFYYDVEPLEISTYLKNKRLKFDSDKLIKDTWIKTVFKEKDTDVYSQIWLKPSVQITGIHGGYSWEAFKNSIPNTASVNMNFRTVKNQSINKIINSFEQWLRFNVADYVDCKLDVLDYCEPCKIEMNNAFIKKAENLLRRIFEKEVIYKYAWSSSSIITSLNENLGISQVLVPLSNEDSNSHWVNENLNIDMIEKSFTFFYNFFSK